MLARYRQKSLTRKERYRQTRNKKRTGRKSRRASKRSHRFFTRRQRKTRTRKQRGGNYGLTTIPKQALVMKYDPEDASAPTIVEYENILEERDSV